MARLRIKAEKWHRSRWCKLLGHIKDGYHGDVPYGAVNRGPIDGLNLEHPYLTLRCDRCGESITVIKFHRTPEPRL